MRRRLNIYKITQQSLSPLSGKLLKLGRGGNSVAASSSSLIISTWSAAPEEAEDAVAEETAEDDIVLADAAGRPVNWLHERNIMASTVEGSRASQYTNQSSICRKDML